MIEHLISYCSCEHYSYQLQTYQDRFGQTTYYLITNCWHKLCDCASLVIRVEVSAVEVDLTRLAELAQFYLYLMFSCLQRITLKRQHFFCNSVRWKKKTTSFFAKELRKDNWEIIPFCIHICSLLFHSNHHFRRQRPHTDYIPLQNYNSQERDKLKKKDFVAWGW